MDYQTYAEEHAVRSEPSVTQQDPGEVLTTKEAGTFLKIQPCTLRKWRKLRKGPPFLRIEGAIRYRKSALEAYLDMVTIDPAQRNEEK